MVDSGWRATSKVKHNCVTLNFKSILFKEKSIEEIRFLIELLNQTLHLKSKKFFLNDYNLSMPLLFKKSYVWLFVI